MWYIHFIYDNEFFYIPYLNFASQPCDELTGGNPVQVAPCLHPKKLREAPVPP